MKRRTYHRKSISLAPQAYVRLRRLAEAKGQTMAAIVEEMVCGVADRNGIPMPSLAEARAASRIVPRIVPQHRVF